MKLNLNKITSIRRKLVLPKSSEKSSHKKIENLSNKEFTELIKKENPVLSRILKTPISGV